MIGFTFTLPGSVVPVPTPSLTFKVTEMLPNGNVKVIDQFKKISEVKAEDFSVLIRILGRKP